MTSPYERLEAAAKALIEKLDQYKKAGSTVRVVDDLTDDLRTAIGALPATPPADQEELASALETIRELDLERLSLRANMADEFVEWQKVHAGRDESWNSRLFRWIGFIREERDEARAALAAATNATDSQQCDPDPDRVVLRAVAPDYNQFCRAVLEALEQKPKTLQLDIQARALLVDVTPMQAKRLRLEMTELSCTLI